ncbi:MAG: site-2 protease family protein [Myxococcota bacterium]
MGHKVDTLPGPTWPTRANAEHPARGDNDKGAPEVSWAWKLGEVRGIGIHVHGTFLVLMAWVVLSHLLEGHTWRVALDGLVFTLTVFGIVVLHELGHALTAQRYGIRTRSITLLPMGGVAQLERIPDKPRQELVVALAGPAVNVALAAVLAAILVVMGEPLVPGKVEVVGGSLLVKLMWTNVSLAVFNLLPAFPMDGGRVLRALLALRLGLSDATRVAARLGQGMALIFGVLGLLSNPMLVFIAFFVWVGAQQEASSVELRTALADIPVRRAMITDFRTVAAEAPLSWAGALLLAGFQQDFPVVSQDRLVGILTRTRLMEALAERGEAVTVESVMRRDFITASPGELVDDVVYRMQRHGCRTVPVLHGGALVGLLTPENIGELVMMEMARQDVGRRATT